MGYGKSYPRSGCWNIADRSPTSVNFSSGYGTCLGRSGYARTFSGTSNVEVRSIEDLCKQRGYNREGNDDVEIEAKITLLPKRGFKRLFAGKFDLDIGSKLSYPYFKKVLPGTIIEGHVCYSFKDNGACALTVVKKPERLKIKSKGSEEVTNVKGIKIIKRTERHVDYPKDDARLDEYARDYAHNYLNISRNSIRRSGEFIKSARDIFLFNENNGRVFVVGSAECESPGRTNLRQLEIEYYGRINGFESKPGELYDEIRSIAASMLVNLKEKGYESKSSIETKFDWLTR